MFLRMRWLAVVSLALAVLVGLACSTSMPVIGLVAATVFIMGGTGSPLVNSHTIDPASPGSYVLYNYDLFEGQATIDYVNAVTARYLVSTGVGDYHRVAVHTPEEFWPVFGPRTFDASVADGAHNLSNCVVGRNCIAHAVDPAVAPGTGDYIVFGYSQSARVATVEKRNLIAQYRNPDGTWQPMIDAAGDEIDASFVLIGNPNRPNGGILERFNGLYLPIIDVTNDGATPTDSCDGTVCHLPTVDISRQYDGWSDFPVRPLNVLATLNAIAGTALIHTDYTSAAVPDMQYQGTTGDTTYYLIPTKLLPILMPLKMIGIPSPILTALDAPLRVIVEWAYDRDIAPGVPTIAQVTGPRDPLADLGAVVAAIPVGLDDALSEIAADEDFRPFHTTKVNSPYGNQGSPLPAAPSTAVATPIPHQAGGSVAVQRKATRSAGRPAAESRSQPRAAAAKKPHGGVSGPRRG